MKQALEAFENAGQGRSDVANNLRQAIATEESLCGSTTAATQEPKKCGLCGEDRAFTGNCGGGRDKPNALCYEGQNHQQPKAAVTEVHKQAPFGYFKPEPFGWTDCAETDEGAIPLYDKPQQKEQEQKPCEICNGTGEVETGIGMMVCDEGIEKKNI